MQPLLKVGVSVAIVVAARIARDCQSTPVLGQIGPAAHVFLAGDDLALAAVDVADNAFVDGIAIRGACAGVRKDKVSDLLGRHGFVAANPDRGFAGCSPLVRRKRGMGGPWMLFCDVVAAPRLCDDIAVENIVPAQVESGLGIYPATQRDPRAASTEDVGDNRCLDSALPYPSVVVDLDRATATAGMHVVVGNDRRSRTDGRTPVRIERHQVLDNGCASPAVVAALVRKNIEALGVRSLGMQGRRQCFGGDEVAERSVVGTGHQVHVRPPAQ